MDKKNILYNLRKNKEYILYYSRLLLKQKVAGSYLGFIWLFLDPLMFMLVYTFVVYFIFNTRIPNFHIHVFIGLTTWKLIAGTITMNTTAIARNKAVFQQVYFNKFVYPTIYVVSNLYEFLIANTLIIVLMLIAKVPFTFHMLEFIPVTMVVVLFTYGLSLVVAHIGVYFFDLRNILEFTLRFFFYASPVMWSYSNLKFAFKWILYLNPVSVIIESYRSLLFPPQTSPDYKGLGIIALISLVIILYGYNLISKNEDEYGKVI